MNYDRYPASTIWEEFPKAYQNVLDFIEAHPEFKGQMQLSGQTFKTMQLVHPEFLEQTQRLQAEGQIDVTGTFYSEPVNMCMDGESNLLTAELGTRIVNEELAQSSGYFLQEYAWHAQLPYVLNQAGVDWVPVRPFEFKSFFPVTVRGLDGSKITAVIQPLRTNKEKMEELIAAAPDGAIFIVGDDYEIPEKFIETYEYFKEFDATHADVEIEWVRVRDYLKSFPPQEELFIDNADLTEIENWDSYARWTADPWDIRVHTLTKQAMAAWRAAKLSVVAGEAFAESQGLQHWKSPDRPIDEAESFEWDAGIDWDIESAARYPSVEERYLKRNGEITLLSRLDHLMAWSVNSDSRGWWPLFERRQERLESFERIIDLSEEIIAGALKPFARDLPQPEQAFRSVMVFNAEKARTVPVTFETALPATVVDANGNAMDTTIFRRGHRYTVRSNVAVPEYGYTVIGLQEGGKVLTPEWTEARSISADGITLTAADDHVVLHSQGQQYRISTDPFQLRLMAEMVFLNRDIKGWHDAEPHGPTRVAVCTNDLHPRLRVDRQLDWAVHLRQEYEIRDGQVHCDWTFFMQYPTLIRKVGAFEGKGREALFKPEGLMARVDAEGPGEVFYDIPFAVIPHNHDEPSFVTMQNFTLQQQADHGILLVAKTGNQAVAVNEATGSLALSMGASTGSGPVRNPEMVVTDVSVYHERPFYAEPFMGTYQHRFALIPYQGDWKERKAPNLARAIANKPFVFDLPQTDRAQHAALPSSASLITLEDPMVEITMMDRVNGRGFARLNERYNVGSSGTLRLGKTPIPYELQPLGIREIALP